MVLDDHMQCALIKNMRTGHSHMPLIEFFSFVAHLESALHAKIDKASLSAMLVDLVTVS